MKVKVVKQSYKLVLHIQFPLNTLKRIITFLEEKNIMMETMLLIADGKHQTILVLHLLMEEKLLKENIELLTNMTGVIRLDNEDDFIEKKGMIRVLSPYLKSK